MARTIRKGPKRWTGAPSRLQQYARNNLGVIMTGDMNKNKKFRDEQLDIYDQYYENRQYDDLMDWEEAAKSDDYIKIRERKPRVIFNLAKVLIDKVAAKLVGSSVFPKFIVEEDPEDTEYFRLVQKVVGFRRALLQPMKHTLLSGSCFVRFYFVEGICKLEHYNSKYCYPKFDDTEELDSLTVKYVFEDPDDQDMNGKPKLKWYKLEMNKNKDILYDNPEYREGVTDPDFKVVEENEHGLGWVQGEWFRTSKHKFTPDGDALIGDILDFLDDMNYSLSQTSQAISYNQEPQLTVNNVDADELDELINSSQKAWDLGREGEAKFVESTMTGVEQARESRTESRQFMLEVVRCVLHDPEKMIANAQSGVALNVLNAPLVELIDELRTQMEPQFVNLLIKVGMSMVELSDRGEETALEIKPGFMPTSLDITCQWPAIYPLTIDDIQKKVMTANSAAQAHIVSHATLTKWVAPDFGVENVDEELQQIQTEAETMPWLNPFGAFPMDGGGGPGGK
jgi:hypothetical protein